MDISLCVLTVWLAFYLRLSEFVTLSGPAFWAVAIAVAIALPIFVISGLYRAIFRYSGFTAMFAVARAIAVYGLLYASAITAVGVADIPRTVGLIQPLLLFFAIAGSRALSTLLVGRHLPKPVADCCTPESSGLWGRQCRAPARLSP